MIELIGVGAAASAASGNISVAWPTTSPNEGGDDIAIIICSQTDNVVSTMPAGWTIVDATNNGGLHRGFWAWHRVDSSAPAAVVITHTAGDAIIARMMVFRGVRRSGDPHETSSVNATALSLTGTATAITTLGEDRQVIFWGSNGDDSTFSAQNAAGDATNPQWATVGAYSWTQAAQPSQLGWPGGEVIDDLTTLGLDTSIMGCVGRKKNAATTGAPTYTSSRSSTNIAGLIALVPEDGVPMVCLSSLSARNPGHVRSNTIHDQSRLSSDFTIVSQQGGLTNPQLNPRGRPFGALRTPIPMMRGPRVESPQLDRASFGPRLLIGA